MKKNKVISFNNLSIGYNDNVLVNNTNFELAGNQIVGVVGLNGCGKTTLFKTILKEIPMLKGNIEINDTPLDALKIEDYVSVVFTDRIKIFGFTVFDLIATAKANKKSWFGNLKKEDKATIQKYIDLLSLNDLAGKQINELSDGQYQKVMIAKALTQETPIILLDEPTAFLDIPNKKNLIQLLKTLVLSQNKTILISTHDEQIINHVCEELIIFNDNKLSKISIVDFDVNILTT